MTVLDQYNEIFPKHVPNNNMSAEVQNGCSDSTRKGPWN